MFSFLVEQGEQRDRAGNSYEWFEGKELPDAYADERETKIADSEISERMSCLTWELAERIRPCLEETTPSTLPLFNHVFDSIQTRYPRLVSCTSNSKSRTRP